MIKEEFVSARYPVEGETGVAAVRAQYTHQRHMLSAFGRFPYCEFGCELRKLFHIGAEFR